MTNALEGFKVVKQIPHTKEMEFSTKRNIIIMERKKNPMLEGESPTVTIDTFEQNWEFIETVKKKIESEQIKVQLLTETDSKARSEERKV